MSPNHLLMRFRQVVRIGPFQRIAMLRIQEPRKIVIETDIAISEITLSLGYSRLPNFSNYFKEIFGASPTTLREKVRHSK